MDGAPWRPSFITPSLAVGGLDCLAGAGEAGVTHIVSVINGLSLADLPPSPGLDLPASHRLLVDLADEEGADLLGALPRVVAWVRDASPPVLLVHCVAGVSRSAAVCAALLMAGGVHVTAAGALAAVAAAHPPADPNPGFRAQLGVWEGRVAGGPEPPAARAWAAARLGEAVAAGEGPGADMAALLAALPALPPDQAAAGSRGGGGGAGTPAPAPATLYRCRACRRLVATSDHAVPLPDPPSHVPAFKGKDKRRGGGGAPTPAPPRAGGAPLGSDGSSLFVQPLRWMFDGAGDAGGPLPTSGKLSCPGCAARLGAFNWAGGQAADGAWVVPAFQLHLSRLDAFASGGGGGAEGGPCPPVPGVRLPARLL